jgi:hypothetical protein
MPPPYVSSYNRMVEMSLRNIEKVMSRADSVDITEGRVAYYRYHEVLQGIADYYGYPLDRTVAAFAALSPNNDYVKNLRSLVTILKGHREGKRPEDCPVSTYLHCRARAWSYITGEVSFLDTVRGKKILNFYANILNPLDPYPVTIDGHALNVWRGRVAILKESLVKPRLYEEVAGDYRKVADRHRLQAHQVQAIVWFTHKRLHGILATSQLSLLAEPGDVWQTLRKPEEIKPFTPELRACAYAPCGASFIVTIRDKRVDRRFCTSSCAGKANLLVASQVSADKRRGSNPDRHIEYRRGDERGLLHRKIMAEYLGRELLPYPEEIVHHIDRNRHHNCVPGRIECGSLFCEGNLQLLTGDAAAEHIRLHYADLHEWRKPKEGYNFEESPFG